MMAKVSSLLTSLQTWLLQRRRSLIAWFSTDQKENSLPEESLKQLPSALRRRLMQQLKHLPSHPDHADQLSIVASGQALTTGRAIIMIMSGLL